MKVSSGKMFGRPVVITCDGKCRKAWGIDKRPRTQITDYEDDYAYFADDELGLAPACPGTWEGCDGKPDGWQGRHNKWCARQCERSEMFGVGEDLTVRSFEWRVYNIPRNRDGRDDG